MLPDIMSPIKIILRELKKYRYLHIILQIKRHLQVRIQVPIKHKNRLFGKNNYQPDLQRSYINIDQFVLRLS